MELSESAYQFSHLILKHFDEKYHNKEESKNMKKEEQLEEKMKTNSEKYNLDYKKFEDLKADENEKAKEILEQNPYLTQMGCSHDRRKVIKS